MSDLRSGESNAQHSRLAVCLVMSTLIVVVCLFLAARLSTNLSTGHYFDYLHWTIAYAAAATLAWMGARRARVGDRISRRWFASGLSVSLVAQLLFALTAHAMKDDDMKCLAAGMDQHLTKPLDRERLRACLHHYLNPENDLNPENVAAIASN